PGRGGGRIRLASHEPVAGENRRWLALDVVHGALYPKVFTYRGAGRHIEVWVASERRTFAGVTSTGIDFQDGDCRNGVRTSITDAQVAGLIAAFDRVIHPRLSAAFSVPPSRDGTNARVGPPGFHPRGAGQRVVVLVDNIRDEAFFDRNNTQNHSSVIGVYSAAVDDIFDRNVMTIDAFDWLHRTGADPVHEPDADDACRSAPAYPHLVEGVFAHEYEHLLEHHADEDEADWVDEGLADWARTLTGYADPARPVTEVGFDNHVQCFLGGLAQQTGANPNPRPASGPENSLTVWGDQGPEEILCDYGAAYSFMEYVHGRYGTRMLTALHRAQANGLAGLQEALGRSGDARALLHDWSAMLALDRVLDGRREDSRFQTPTLDAAIPWDSAEAYATPGAPPNGADFVRLRDGSGEYLRVRDLRSLEFDGASALRGRPVEWVVDPTPPNGGGPALYTGAGNNLDRSIVRAIRVPAANPTLAFDAQWNVEEDPTGGWDFTFVQVSADGGATYTSIPCTSSRTDASPHARSVMHDNLPGYTAYSGGWRSERCDLTRYAGQFILVGFRHVTDGSVPGDPDDPAATIPPGFWLRNVALGGTTISAGGTLEGWLSPSQARPTVVEGFTVQLVAYSSRGHGRPALLRVALDSEHDARLRRSELVRLGAGADVVGAIVMYDESTETVGDYAPYALRANGVLQPGG
ncbi:MAG: immune inhibitor A, partial [Actinomycetota bacterium]|nr:immune inhibitor A [Actinomycetota bacterium]